jgi:regulator of RNase E activity RraA
MNQRRGLRAIFAIPLLLALASIAGLVIALTGDGLRDAASWAALAIPVFAVGWAMHARRR